MKKKSKLKLRRKVKSSKVNKLTRTKTKLENDSNFHLVLKPILKNSGCSNMKNSDIQTENIAFKNDKVDKRVIFGNAFLYNIDASEKPIVIDLNVATPQKLLKETLVVGDNHQEKCINTKDNEDFEKEEPLKFTMQQDAQGSQCKFNTWEDVIKKNDLIQIKSDTATTKVHSYDTTMVSYPLEQLNNVEEGEDVLTKDSKEHTNFDKCNQNVNAPKIENDAWSKSRKLDDLVVLL